LYEQPDVSHASFVTSWTPLSVGELSAPQHGIAIGALNKGRQSIPGRIQGLPAFAQEIVQDIKQFL
jgi:hypothetical protein